MMKVLTLHTMDPKSPEGRLLFAALAILTTKVYGDKNPDQVLEILHNEADRIERVNSEGNGCAVASHPSPLISAVNMQMDNEHKDREDKLNRLKLASDLIIERARMVLSPAEQAGLAGALVKIYRHYLEAKYQSL